MKKKALELFESFCYDSSHGDRAISEDLFIELIEELHASTKLLKIQKKLRIFKTKL